MYSKSDLQRYNSKLENAKTNILRRTTERALQILAELKSDRNNFDKIADIKQWEGWAFMMNGEWERASAKFKEINPEHPLKILSDKVIAEKYPVTFTKTISYILPGAGQIYLGEYTSGFLSFGWNLLWGGITLESFLERRIFDGFVTGTLLWHRFYRGNNQNTENFIKNKNIEIYNRAYIYLKTKYTGEKP